MVELTENEMLVYNKVVHINRKNYFLLFRRLLEYLSLLFKIISGTLVIYDILQLLEIKILCIRAKFSQMQILHIIFNNM